MPTALTADQVNAIFNASDLTDLRDALNDATQAIEDYKRSHPSEMGAWPDMDTELKERGGVGDLPLFDGGYVPGDTRDAYSWGPEGVLYSDGPSEKPWAILPWADYDPSDSEIIAWSKLCDDYGQVESLVKRLALDEDSAAIAWSAWLLSRPHAVEAGDRVLLPALSGDGGLLAVEYEATTGLALRVHSDVEEDYLRSTYGDWQVCPAGHYRPGWSLPTEVEEDRWEAVSDVVGDAVREQAQIRAEDAVLYG